jgi:GTP-binding protein HflX
VLDTPNRTTDGDRAVLAGLYATDAEIPPDLSLDELESLVVAANGSTVGRVIQRRGRTSRGPRGGRLTADPATLIGRGKVETVHALVEEECANLVVFDNELSPAQIRELEKRIGCRVIDRSELILDIFATRARTREAMLQVDLAQLEYTAPRLRGMWSHLERQAGGGGAKSGGIGTRGPGEQQIEIDRRIVQKRIIRLKAELEKMINRRERQVTARAGRVWTVGLVGYTNAGKSTLMNTLTGAGVLVKDQLFATLDTTSRRWAVRPGVDIPLSDTVGFVRNLPHHLVASFRSTLAEALHADLLLHVADASHPDAVGQIEAVHKVLSGLGVDQDRIVGLLNKADAVADRADLQAQRSLFEQSVVISAKTREGLDTLTELVVARRAEAWTGLDLLIPHAHSRLIALVHQHGEVLSEEYEDDGWRATVSIPKALVWQLEEWSTPTRLP